QSKINNLRPLDGCDPFFCPLQFVFKGMTFLRRQMKIRPLDAFPRNRSLARQLELPQNILLDLTCGGRPERDWSGTAKLLPNFTQARVIGPKIMSPLRDAVRFVDREQ